MTAAVFNLRVRGVQPFFPRTCGNFLSSVHKGGSHRSEAPSSSYSTNEMGRAHEYQHWIGAHSLRKRKGWRISLQDPRRTHRNDTLLPPSSYLMKLRIRIAWSPTDDTSEHGDKQVAALMECMIEAFAACRASSLPSPVDRCRREYPKGRGLNVYLVMSIFGCNDEA